MFAFVKLYKTYKNYSKMCRHRKAFLLVYKTVSPEHDLLVHRLNFKENTQKWLKHSLDDPFVKKLAKNSTLTNTQLETLLIDILAENMAEKSLRYHEKAKLRLLAVTRGAFNRTLRQARKNIIRSIYTILLLGYLGVFEDTSLIPYLEIANKLQTYMSSYKDILKNKGAKDETLRIMNKLREELEVSLEQFSKPKALSTRM
jgi:hypothetical protein